MGEISSGRHRKNQTRGDKQTNNKKLIKIKIKKIIWGSTIRIWIENKIIFFIWANFPFSFKNHPPQKNLENNLLKK